ncbi:hypothetical protein DFP72DRAFT_34509 [Ephemerocybe angulata]|uniref:Secreted protein n=1 Tax=Ephemerocybe angulata TaxID=980116 RepID=A0A8H6M9T4_9AGAR|nr:hypothetical protein DFP72DRAFT_34509 [Tulosesus angulatus]
MWCGWIGLLCVFIVVTVPIVFPSGKAPWVLSPVHYPPNIVHVPTEYRASHGLHESSVRYMFSCSGSLLEYHCEDLGLYVVCRPAHLHYSIVQRTS